MPSKAKKTTPAAAEAAHQAETSPATASKVPTDAATTGTGNEPALAKRPPRIKASKAEPEAVLKKQSPKRPKLVRDSFTFPADDYARIAELKERMLGLGCEVKKSELLRAGLTVLSGLADQKLMSAVDSLIKIKTGRPGKK